MKCRTEWSKKAKVTMIMKGLSIKEVARMARYTPEYASGIIHGRIDSPKAKSKISDILDIADD